MCGAQPKRDRPLTSRAVGDPSMTPGEQRQTHPRIRNPLSNRVRRPDASRIVCWSNHPGFET